MARTYDAKELKHWMELFRAYQCLQTVFLQCPDDVYGHLRQRGYVDAEHNLSHRGERFIQRVK